MKFFRYLVPITLVLFHFAAYPEASESCSKANVCQMCKYKNILEYVDEMFLDFSDEDALTEELVSLSKGIEKGSTKIDNEFINKFGAYYIVLSSLDETEEKLIAVEYLVKQGVSPYERVIYRIPLIQTVVLSEREDVFRIFVNEGALDACEEEKEKLRTFIAKLKPEYLKYLN
ncbi:MAG: hypothetical protein OQJ89_10770 [Kangiellaceae bacterium]|nr:hypothetical protein [Kangiellaceae bacterium]MCW8999497.1 hypothetical protein [Kangiellaceae bacterium]MCW9017439.1 hypothetical protein [Kangiellaceae bacterium]